MGSLGYKVYHWGTWSLLYDVLMGFLGILVGCIDGVPGVWLQVILRGSLDIALNCIDGVPG